MPFDYSCKCVLVGDTGTGKSSLLQNFINPGQFNPAHDVTIGVDFASKTLTASGSTVKLQIWDTAGQEAFRSIVRTYYRGSAACILVYDMTRRSTFAALPGWLDELRAQNEGRTQLIVVANKADLHHRREVSAEDGALYAESIGALFVEVSAKTGTNVDTMFQTMAAAVVRKIFAGVLDPSAQPSHGVRFGFTNAARAHAIGLNSRSSEGEARERMKRCCAIS